MICPECLGTGTAIYYCETARDENSVTVKKFEDICHTCHGSRCKPQTNADRIRAMSDEELAKTLNGSVCPPLTSCNEGQQCIRCWTEWLQQPAEEV